jgi:hypothetical protein
VRFAGLEDFSSRPVSILAGEWIWFLCLVFCGLPNGYWKAGLYALDLAAY